MIHPIPESRHEAVREAYAALVGFFHRGDREADRRHAALWDLLKDVVDYDFTKEKWCIDIDAMEVITQEERDKRDRAKVLKEMERQRAEVAELVCLLDKLGLPQPSDSGMYNEEHTFKHADLLTGLRSLDERYAATR